MIAGAELDSMRATLNASLPDLATIQRPARTADGHGGHSTTWNTLAASVPCRLGPRGNARGDESISGSAVGSRAFYLVTFSAGRDVTPKDRILIGSRTLEVIEVLDRNDSWEISRRVSCSEVV